MGQYVYSFINDGLAVTKDGTNVNQVNMSSGRCYFYNSDDFWTFPAQSFTTTQASATYYLDAFAEGTLSWSTTRTPKTGYVEIATVTTDASGNVSTVTQSNNDMNVQVTPDEKPDWIARGMAFSAKLNRFNVHDYGAVGDGIHDDTNAIQAAVNAAQAAGGGIVVLPPGIYKITRSIYWNTNISLVGAGAGKSVIKPYGTGFAVIHANGSDGFSTSNTLNDCTFAEFEMDGTNLGDNTKPYNIAEKGIYTQYMIRARFVRVYIHDFPATGFGADFLVDSSFIACDAYNNGRLFGINGGSTAGGAGIGVGTGQWQVENTAVIGCDCKNNGNFGIFFERQEGTGMNAYQSQGIRVIGCTASYNANAGICDKGADGMETIGCTMANNTKYGFQTLDSPMNGSVTKCKIRNNGGHGIYQNDTGDGSYKFDDNDVFNNGSAGIQCVPVSTDTFTNTHVTNNRVYGNQKYGINLSNTSGGSMVDARVEGNTVYNNGQSGSYTNGIQIGCNLTNARIVNNKCYDNQGTKTQGYGVGISSGITITGGRISQNDLLNNKTGAFTNAGTISSTTRVENNAGYNPVTTLTAPTMSASGTALTNPFPYSCRVYVSGGTVTGVSIGATATGMTSGQFVLEFGETITLTYSTAPTWVWIGM